MIRTVALVLTLAAGVAAQQTAQFRNDLVKRHLPNRDFRLDETYDVELADYDGDGDLDAYVLNIDRVSQSDDELLLNDGFGRFRRAANAPPSLAWTARAAAAADLDNDGDVDLFGPGFVSLNDGSGGFAPSTPPTDLADVMDVALADVDGDGDLDAVMARWLDSIAVVHNDGSGGFPTPAVTTFGVNDSPTVDVGDFDADGDVDVVSDRIWFNNGGVFAATTASLFGQPSRVRSGDVDGDGDLDVFFGSVFGGALFSNDGTGQLTDVTGTNLLHRFHGDAMALGDLDGDGDVDVVDGAVAHLNDGTGVFRTVVELPSSGQRPSLGDVDGDGDLDVVFGRFGNWLGWIDGVQNTLLINDGNANFQRGVVERAGGGLGLSTVTVADFDADGDEDLAAAYSMFSATMENVGGRFESAPYRFQLGANWFGDLDSDGDVDLLTKATAPADSLKVWRTAPVPPVTPAQVLSNTLEITDGRLVDLDGDSDLDFVGTGAARTIVLENTGSGTFVDRSATALPTAPPATAIAVGDYDADGLPDFALATPASNRLYRNVGGGVFADVSASLPGTAGNTVDIQLADFDGNGRDDIVSGDADGRLTLLLSLAGVFADWSSFVGQTVSSVKTLDVGDVDDDGDFDLVVLDDAGSVTILVNDGLTVLTPTPTPRFPFATSDLELTDVDGDGDLDIAYVAYGTLQVAINHHRQLASPYVPSLGGPYVLEVTAEPGYAQQPALVSLFLGLATLAQPVSMPIGSFALDPNRTTVVPPIVMPGSGELEISFPLPNASALNGLGVHWQALFAHPNPAGPPRYALSHLVSDTLSGN